MVILGHFAARRLNNKSMARSYLTISATRLNFSTLDPLIDYLKGNRTEKDLFAAAEKEEVEVSYHLYLGIDKEIKGLAAEAKKHFEWVKEHSTPDHLYYIIAMYELMRMEKS
jgi:hypothetical protein